MDITKIVDDNKIKNTIVMQKFLYKLMIRYSIFDLFNKSPDINVIDDYLCYIIYYIGNLHLVLDLNSKKLVQKFKIDSNYEVDIIYLNLIYGVQPEKSLNILYSLIHYIFRKIVVFSKRFIKGVNSCKKISNFIKDLFVDNILQDLDMVIFIMFFGTPILPEELTIHLQKKMLIKNIDKELLRICEHSFYKQKKICFIDFKDPENLDISKETKRIISKISSCQGTRLVLGILMYMRGDLKRKFDNN